MTILVCPLSKVAEMVGLNRPERVISLLDPEWPSPKLGPEYADRHLRLSFHDVHVPGEEHVMPSGEHVRTLLQFLEPWECRETLLIHCRAGIGRSTAAAFIAACAADPVTEEHDIALALRQASPLARPNEMLVRLADREMGREGRMYRAIVSTGESLSPPDAQENEPFQLSVFGPGKSA